MHGSLAGHRFEATNKKPVNRKEIDLSEFGVWKIKDFTLEQIKTIHLKENFFTDEEKQYIEKVNSKSKEKSKGLER